MVRCGERAVHVLLACDGVSLDELVPLDMDPFRLEKIDLFAHGTERDERVIESVGDQETLFARHW